jgi:Leucine-rich repeat (LRR) protein
LDVEKFYSDNFKWKKLPKNILKVFMNINEIQIINAELPEVTKDDLEVFSKLINLWLYNNKLKYLRDDVFASNLQLETIDLHGNQISHVDPRTFSHLNKLRLLRLERNVCQSLSDALTRSSVVKMVSEIENTSCTSVEFVI